MGMSTAWSGPLMVDHAVMSDAIDTASVQAMERLASELRELRALFAKRSINHWTDPWCPPYHAE